MDFGGLRELSLEVNLQAHGLDVVVTRPVPDDTPIETRGIWLTNQTEDIGGQSFARREPIRLMAVARGSVPSIPINTLIEAPEAPGGESVIWRVDGLERREALHDRVWVVRAPESAGA